MAKVKEGVSSRWMDTAVVCQVKVAFPVTGVLQDCRQHVEEDAVEAFD